VIFGSGKFVRDFIKVENLDHDLQQKNTSATAKLSQYQHELAQLWHHLENADWSEKFESASEHGLPGTEALLLRELPWGPGAGEETDPTEHQGRIPTERPETILADKLGSLQKNKEEENERIISAIFSNAAQVCKRGAETDTHGASQSRLFNSRDLEEFRQTTHATAEQMFDSHLKTETWLKMHPKYAPTKDLVKKEVF
jgi:hypothetical protein